LPILPDREATLRACIREGLRDRLWAVAIGDNSTLEYRRLIEAPADLDGDLSLFDGSASLVKGELLDMIRAELRKPNAASIGGEAVIDPGPIPPSHSGENQKPQPEPGAATTVIPVPPKRHRTVRLTIGHMGIGKTSNLQPYLFKVLQEQDAGAELSVTIDVTSAAGLSEEVLEKRIIEAFDQLGIDVKWEPA
jgi:hypothetical protein